MAIDDKPFILQADNCDVSIIRTDKKELHQLVWFVCEDNEHAKECAEELKEVVDILNKQHRIIRENNLSNP